MKITTMHTTANTESRSQTPASHRDRARLIFFKHWGGKTKQTKAEETPTEIITQTRDGYPRLDAAHENTTWKGTNPWKRDMGGRHRGISGYQTCDQRTNTSRLKSLTITSGTKRKSGNLQKMTKNESGRAGKIWLI